MFSTQQILFSYVKVDLYALFHPHPALLNRVFTVCAAVFSYPDNVGNLFDVPNEYVDVLGVTLTLKTQTDEKVMNVCFMRMVFLSRSISEF